MNPSSIKQASEAEGGRDEVRGRIIEAALELLLSGGREKLTTRSISKAAGVQAPTIYRLFGDKSGLLDALAEHQLSEYFRNEEAREPQPDPVEDLRDGWNLHVGFGLANPALYALMYGDPRPGSESAAAAAGKSALGRRIRRIAISGRLRVDEELASQLISAAGRGTVLTLLSMSKDARDGGLSDAARESTIAAITNDSQVSEDSGPATAAITLRARLADTSVFSDGELHLLEELLDRLATDRPSDS